MTLEIIPKGQKGNVFTVRPSEKITNPDGTTTIQDQSFIGYSAVKMIFRDPQGVEKKYTATYIPKAGLVNLKGVRIDQEPPIDDTNINDGNDGTERDGHRNEINSSPVNIGSLDSYIEVAGGVELELNRSTSGDVIGGFVIFFNEAVEGVFELVLYDQRGVNIVRTVPFSNPVRGINYIIDD
ncbi:MAG: hypothetical protein K8823_1553 [Cenarchaeum symbiont of Oopsacas minuta]|nr:hypothetical protein [Cenarchaeum symbiont of Oopsacas minuta]